MIQVRKEQVEYLLRLRADVEAKAGAAERAQELLNAACAGVLAGVAPDRSGVAEAYVQGEVGVIVLEEVLVAPTD